MLILPPAVCCPSNEWPTTALNAILRTSCFFKIVPYNWNSRVQRLEAVGCLGMTLFYTTSCIPAWGAVFMWTRLLQTRKMDAPPRIRVMNIIWALAYSLVFLCKVQVMVRTKQVMGFANAMLDQRDRVLEKEREKLRAAKEEEKKAQAMKGVKRKRKLSRSMSIRKITNSLDWVSAIIFISTFLWFWNPPAHAVVLLDMPCAPQYWSSLVLPCKWIGDHPVPIAELLPYIVWEYFVIGDMKTIVAFMWIIIFLGLTWIKDEMLKHDEDRVNTYADGCHLTQYDLKDIVLDYRRVQVLTRFINDAFNLYLTYFPSLLFLIAGTLLFATIRFTHLPIHIFLVFPVCSFRCLLEATTQLEAAANVNLVSEQYLGQFDSDTKRFMSMGYTELAKYLAKFRRSCKKLTCSAGSLYTLEKTIVLVSLDNCAQLLFNLLVAYPKPEEGNWGRDYSLLGAEM